MDPDFARHGFSFSKHVRASRHVFKALAYIAGKYTTRNEVNITLGFNRKDNLIT